MSIYDLLNPSFQIANEWAKYNTRELVIAIKMIVNTRDKNISSALKDLKTNINSHSDFVARYIEIEKFNQALLQISEQFLADIQDLIQIDIFERWREKIVGALDIENKEMAESITSALEAEIKIGRKYPKWIKAYFDFIYRIREYISRLKNPEKTFYKYGRRFNLGYFIDHFITLPMGTFVFEEWINAIELVLNNNSQENAVFISFKDHVMFTSQITKNNEYWASLFSNEPVEGVDGFIRSHKDLDSALKTFETSMADRLNEFYYKLIQDVSEKARVAGTYMIPNSSFSPSKTIRKWKDLKNDQLDVKVNWATVFKEQVDNWQKNMEITHLQLRAGILVNLTRKEIEEKMKGLLIPIFKQARNEVASAKKYIESNSGKSYSNGLIKIKDELSDQFQKKYTRPILEYFDQFNFPGIYTDSINEFKSEFMTISNLRTVSASDNGKKEKKQDIPLQYTLLENVYSPLSASNRADCDKFKKTQKSCARDLLTLSEVIEFNLDAAEKLVRKKRDDESRETALNGLERALSRIDDVLERFQAMISETNNKFSANILNAISILNRFYNGQELIDFFNTNLRKEKRFFGNEYFHVVLAHLRKFWPNPKVYIVNSIQSYQQQRLQKSYTQIRESQESVADERISRELLTTYGKMETLPYIYQQLFSWKPLQDERLFISRHEEIAHLMEAQQLFEEGHSETVAVIGEKGSGKTSIMNIFSNKSNIDAQWHKISFDRTTIEENNIAKKIGVSLFQKPAKTFVELSGWIDQMEKTKAVILDDIHNLFLREIDGFGTLERLLLLISNTGKKIFWFTTCDFYAWHYLNKVIHIEKFFSRTIDLKPFSAELIKEAITRRHQITGFGLYFDPGERYGKSRMYEHLKTEEEKQNFLQSNFFFDLEKASYGNIRIALLLWLNATIGFKENDLRVSFRFGPDRSFLYQLGDDEHFTLAAFVIHEYLTSEQYALVFHISKDEGHQKLEKLRRLGILDNREGNYSVHPFLYPNIIKTLKIKKMIY